MGQEGRLRKRDEEQSSAWGKGDTWCPSLEPHRPEVQWAAGRWHGVPPGVLTGTEGPGTGVDCVTVVTARVRVEDTVVVTALELVMFTLSPWVLSTSPWSLAAGGGSGREGSKQREV